MFKKKEKLCSKSKAVTIMYLEQKARELEDSITEEGTIEAQNKEIDIGSIRETIDFLIKN